MKYWQVILLIALPIIVIIVAILLMIKKNSNNINTTDNSSNDNSSNNNNDDDSNNLYYVDLYQVFSQIKSQYSVDIAINVERIYRLETRHFTSNIYNQTRSAGMLAFSSQYPYGWMSLLSFWNLNQNYRPIGIYNSTNGKRYLIFNSYGGFFTLAEFLRLHGNNAGSWNSTDISQQQNYNNIVSQISTYYC